MSRMFSHLILLVKRFLFGEWIRSNSFIFTFLLSGLLGFLFGVLYPYPQDAVEAAQVISGVVPYPQPTVWYLLISSVWVLLDQICAFFLLLGVSELALSYLVSGLLGMISFQALSLTVLAFSNSCLLSVATPFFILLTRAYAFDVNYPIDFVSPVTWGVLGLSFTLLTTAVIGNKRYKLGAFLLGIAPAVHFVSGAFLWGVVAICLLLGYKEWRSYFNGTVKYFMFGCLIFAFSLSFHVLTSPHIPKVSHETASYYLSIFIGVWEEHRHPIDFTSTGVYLNITAFVVTFLWLTFFGKALPENIRFLLRIFMVSSAAGMFFGVLTHLPNRYVPDIVISLMPQRMLNFSIFGFLALLLGLFGCCRDRFGIQLGLAILIVILLLLSLGILPAYYLFIVMFGGAAALIVLKSVKPLPVRKPWLAGFPIAATVVLLLISISLSVIGLYPSGSTRAEYKIPDRTNNEFLDLISKGQGILLVPMHKESIQPLPWIQLVTRRPILLKPGMIDLLPYALGVGPEMDRVLREIYGIELSNPCGKTPCTKDLLVLRNKETWEARSPEQWTEIRNVFGVTEILTFADWNLRLHVKACDNFYVLYDIPF